MDAQELNLSPGASAPADKPLLRRFGVSGESMEGFLRTGDSLIVEAGRRARVGDIVVVMGGRSGPRLFAHRVLAAAIFEEGSGWLLTKGDFHLLPDLPLRSASVVGVARVLERGGRSAVLDCPLARALGLAAAVGGFAGAVLYRLVQLLGWLGHSAVLRLRLPLTRRSIGLQTGLETLHLRAVRPLLRVAPSLIFRVLERHVRRRHAEAAASASLPPAGTVPSSFSGGGTAGLGPAPLQAGGEITGDAVWSDTVHVSGDVVVLPGATLTVRAGTTVLFSPHKRFHHGVRRRVGEYLLGCVDPRLGHLIVYGELRVEGRLDAPVLLRAAQGAWGGMVFLGDGAQASELRYAELRGALIGVRCLDAARVRIEHGEFYDCTAAAVSLAGRSAAELSVCRISRAPVGVMLDSRAAGVLQGCEFLEVESGIIARGGATVRAAGCRLRGSQSGTGITLEASASGDFMACRVEGFRCGLSLKGDALVEWFGGELLGGFDLVTTADSARLRVGETTLSGAARSLLHAAGGSLSLRSCRFENAPLGAAFTGSAAGSLHECVFWECRDFALTVGETADVRAFGTSFERSGTGVLLEEGARGAFRNCRFMEGTGHGLWLRGRSRGLVAGGTLRAHRANGLYAAGQARLFLRGVELRRNRSALSAVEEAEVAASETLFSTSVETNISFSGGRHVLRGCRLEAAPIGLALTGNAELRFDGGVLRDHPDFGARLDGSVRARFGGAAFSGNGTALSAEGAAETVLENCTLAQSRRHGAWLRGGSRTTISDCGVRENGENGIYLSGEARVEMKGGVCEGNRCGLACADAAGLRAEGAGFLRNERINLSLSGGAHSFDGCLFGWSDIGAALRGSVPARFLRCRFRRNRLGFEGTGDVRASFEGCSWDKHRTALWAQERAYCRIVGGSFRRQVHGIRASQHAVLEVEGVRFSDHEIAVQLEDEAFCRLSSGIFRRNWTGVKADARSSLELRRSRFRGCVLDAVWGGARTRLDLKGSDFRGNRIAVHVHEACRCETEANVFLDNPWGDLRRFKTVRPGRALPVSKVGTAPAADRGEMEA